MKDYSTLFRLSALALIFWLGSISSPPPATASASAGTCLHCIVWANCLLCTQQVCAECEGKSCTVTSCAGEDEPEYGCPPATE
jgi:hypothetical protein